MGERDGDDLNDPSLLDDDGVEDNLGGGKNADGDDGTDGADDAADGGEDKGGKGAKKDDDAGFEIVIEDGADDDGDGALDDEDDGEGKDKEFVERSKKIRARIERERRIAREARAQADAERAARIQAEQKSIRTQKEALETIEAAIDAQIPAVTAQLRQAKEDGKTDDEIKHQTTLSRLNAQKYDMERAKRQLAEEEEKVKNASVARGPNRLAQDWKQRNPWYGHARYTEQSAITGAIDKSLMAAGFDPNDPEYYAELDRRIRRRMPELQRFQNGGLQRQQQRRDPAGAVVRRGAPAGGEQAIRKGGKVVLTKADLENMMNFGLDPKDPKAQREYALQKMGGDNA